MTSLMCTISTTNVHYFSLIFLLHLLSDPVPVLPDVGVDPGVGGPTAAQAPEMKEYRVDQEKVCIFYHLPADNADQGRDP